MNKEPLSSRRESTPSKGRVFVGMSGGVDSSVSAYLLKEAGYQVTGVFIKVWHPDWAPCNWKDDRLDAMRVAAQLKIPFITIDLEKEYKEKVVDYMVDEYENGRTPNPDVMCNTFVKFGAFYDWAMANGADYVATGHYCQSVNGTLIESPDEGKDQTYFLWQITKEKLDHTLFPVGHLMKDEVRRIAKAADLPNAEKKDSQGLCFVGKVDLDDFLSHFIEKKTGQVINENGEVIGHHDGAWQFTLGQRHGFTLTNQKTDRDAMYVIKKDVEANKITVSHKVAIREDGKIAITPHWISGNVPRTNKLLLRYRYHQKPIPVEIETSGSKTLIKIHSASADITPGQSAVLYDGKTCLGGGIIAE